MSAVVPEGGLVAFAGGEGFESYVAGVYRALRDLDLDEAARIHAAGTALPDPREARDHPCLVGRASVAGPLEVGFLEWLVREGWVAREPVALATLEVRHRRGRAPALAVGFEPAGDGAEPGPRGPSPR